MPKPLYPLVTRDPISGGELVVTRLECPESGVVLEGNFSLGWLSRLSTAQLEFVGLFLAHRGNLQRLAPEIGVSYNTARNRLDEIVTALGGQAESTKADRLEVLSALKEGELEFEEALKRLKT
jgi:hypothetical protein